MEYTARPLNRLALASFVCGVLSLVIFAVFVTIGALQETGHYIFIETYRYEGLARILMLILSLAAVLLPIERSPRSRSATEPAGARRLRTLDEYSAMSGRQ